MNKYYFLYKNSLGTWGDTTNPIFIAMHTYCRAIPRSVIAEAGYDLIGDFIYLLNSEPEKFGIVERDIIKEYEIY